MSVRKLFRQIILGREMPRETMGILISFAVPQPFGSFIMRIPQMNRYA